MSLKHNDIQALLGELVKRLGQQNIKGGLRIVGGAAIALQWPGRSATQDIDAVLLPADPILDTAQAMAEELDLASNWLNNAAQAFVPFEASLADWSEIFNNGEVSISLASPQLLLAMKLHANRGRRDADDITYLLATCAVTSVAQAQEIYEHFFSQSVLSDSAVSRILTWLKKTSRE